ncbi:hypothetical protein [Amycolatopsis sp.]|uniref:hypothetical protein n=1 Tax=Amycolatopsis sp. TaxID=37632 RepID=UPI002CF7022B|nr:hypothetical protein [Amycolatopsis sp.]HVV12016.1 hypothetical protein [Amycolatopsis sp.]
MRALTREIQNPKSPVYRFLADRFGNTKEVARQYREAAGPLRISSNGANAGTVGTAADWLLRFLLHPEPDVHLAMAGAARYVGPKMVRAVADLATRLGAAPRPYTGGIGVAPGDAYELVLAEIADLVAVADPGAPEQPVAFTGPVVGNDSDPELLMRGCWALALLTEVYRAGSRALMNSPLAPFYRADADSSRQQPAVTVDELLSLASPAALEQLAQLREVFEAILIPQLAARAGLWALGPWFAGSRLIGGADADLIASGLLLDLKTGLGSKRPDGTRWCSLERKDLYQLIGYALLDFTDSYQITELGLFSARFGYCATWPIDKLLAELAGGPVDLAAARADFEHLLKNK